MFNRQIERQITTVSKLNRLVKSVLESEVGQVWVEGEVSNLTKASSGHWYFTLKDDSAQLRCSFFRQHNSRCNHPLKVGDQVVVNGQVGLYEARGDYQLIVSYLEPAGEGQLKREFERIKAQMAADGWFSPEHKKPLPEPIQTIGVITSPTGAAIRDIIHVMARRNPLIEIIVYPTLVQGAAAAGAIRQMLAKAIERNEVDALLIGRGGGSIEDLWCFNDPQLAQDVFHCPIPVVSCVGHEIDFTIIDFVADVRAATPSAAAELVSKPLIEYVKQLQQYQNTLCQRLEQQLQRHHHQLQLLEHRLSAYHPQDKLTQQQQTLDQLEQRLKLAYQRVLERQNIRITHLRSRLIALSPDKQVAQQRQRLHHLETRLGRHGAELISQRQHRLANLAQLLNGLSPLQVMQRGYAVVKDENGVAQTSVKAIAIGDQVSVYLKDGRLSTTVNQLDNEALPAPK